MRIPTAVHCAILAAGLVAGCSERPPTADRPASKAAKLASNPASSSKPSAKPPSRPPTIGPVKPSFRRWAVICSKDAQQAGLGDLVTAELSKEKDLELVDREQLDAVTKELQLAAALESQAAATRLKMGQLVKADALLLLCIGNGQKGRVLKVVVSKCLYGARLRIEYLPYRSGAKRTWRGIVPRLSPRSASNLPAESGRSSACRRSCRRTWSTITTACKTFSRGSWKWASRKFRMSP